MQDFSRKINIKVQITNNITDMKKKVLKITGITIAVLAICTVLCAVVFVGSVVRGESYVKFDKTKLNEVYTSVTVLDNDGQPLNQPLYINGYKQIPLSALPRYTYMAFVAVEDKRFYSHHGIDCKRVVGALAHNIKSGSYKEGASTISQQLIKNTHLDNNKNIKRKINEMLLARQLEKNYSKNEILEMYLNTIYFGRNAYGIETAANVYFNKSAADLTVSESAVLAGMIKAPNTYAPDKNPDKCKSRRDRVLDLMREQNIINYETYTQAVNAEISYKPYTGVGTDKSYVYHVVNEACRLLNMTPMQLYKSDFVIETYCNQQTQQYLTELTNGDATATKQNGLAQLSCLVCNNTGGIEACSFRGENAFAKRQAGSALKPIAVYAPALNEQIITQASPVLDEQTDFNGYKPTNAGGYNGWVTIKYAVAKSLNVPAVKTLNALGLGTAQKYLEKLGIDGEQNLSLALGNAEGGIDIFTLAKCYATLANDGKSNDVAFIKNIYGDNGLIYSRNKTDARVFRSGANYLMTDMLINTVNNGTAKALANKNYQVAAKTGTVGAPAGNTDALVAGYTTRNTFVVWYSGDLDNKITGATAPCAFADKLLKKMYSDDLPADFTAPQTVQKINIDTDSLQKNQLVLRGDNGEKYWFEQGNIPKGSVRQIKYDYALQANIDGNVVSIELPAADGTWQLYKKTGDIKTKIEAPDGILRETIDTPTQYFAQLYQSGKLVYTTPAVQVCPVNDSADDVRHDTDENPTGKHDAPHTEDFFFDLTDFWYWRK